MRQYKKRIVVIVMVLVMMFVFLFSSSALDISSDTLIPSKIREPFLLAQEFLTRRAENEWLLYQNDLTSFFISRSDNMVIEEQIPQHLLTYVHIIDSRREYREFVGVQKIDMQVSYTLLDYSVESDSFVLDIYEDLSYYIMDADKIRDDQRTYIGNSFRLTIQKEGSSYIISDIESEYDNLYHEYKYAAFDKNEYTEMSIRNMQTLREKTSEYVESKLYLYEDRSSTTVNCITNPYSPTQAAAYANIYSKTNDIEHRNREFFYINDADCANFVSQCVWAGFGGDQLHVGGAATTTYPYDANGTTENTCWYRSSTGYSSWYGAVSLYEKYAIGSNASQTEYGWKSITYEAWDESTQQNSFPTTYNYHGAIFFVQGALNGPHPENGHAIFISKATNNNPANMRYCAHTSPANNVVLADMQEYINNNIRVVIPTAYKIPVVCTGTYTTHSYPAVADGYRATCQRCGYVNMYFNFKWAKYAVNSTVTIEVSELRNNPLYSLSATVLNEDDEEVATGFVSNNGTLSFTTTNMGTAGLYRVRVTAKDMNPEISGAITREYEYTILVGDTLPQ
ncbi:MAG: amidase domain-containing protein [Clostridia bacterium]|nr:amidase domain-containing protein [Clostridia bacterium]